MNKYNWVSSAQKQKLLWCFLLTGCGQKAKSFFYSRNKFLKFSLSLYRYNVLLFVMLYCLPVTFNLTISSLTGRRLWGGKKSTFADLDPRSQALHTSRLKTRQKIAKMVVCLVLLFAVSWLPLYLVDLWIDCQHQPWSWLLQTRPFAQWLGLTNSSLNPICYCFIGDLYRSAKVIRTRYYQKVAALFSNASFSSSAAVVSPAAIITETKGMSAEHHRIAVAVAASTSVVTIPRLLGLAGSQGQIVSSDSEIGSGHSISDWCESSPSECDGSLFHCQLHTLQQPVQKHSTPARRHSVNEVAVSLSLRIEPVEIDLLPLRRHSEDRIHGVPADKRAVITNDRDRFCYTRQHRSKSSRNYSLEGNAENKTTNMTSLWMFHIIRCISRGRNFLFLSCEKEKHTALILQFIVDSLAYFRTICCLVDKSTNSLLSFFLHLV